MRRLRLQFERPSDLARELESNISAGGALIRSQEALEPRELVEVELALAWCEERVVLEAEVVFAGAGRVAVEFSRPAGEIRAELARFTADPRSAKDPKPDVNAKTVARVAGRPKPSQAPATPAAPARGDPLADVSDRRKSPRSVARVPARVEATHVSLEGRTRDLSETGVLISADGTDLPLGKRVQIELHNPVSGEQIEVAGQVTRHVQADGTVAAVGIHFDASPEKARALKDYVRDVRNAEAERQAAGISGRIEELGMANLIQMLGQSSPKGTLTATRGNEEATIAFENGNVRYALLGSLRGVKAIARMLQWSDGTFSFHAQVDAITDETKPIALQMALLEATRQVDEARRSQPLDPRSTFGVDRGALAAAGELNKTEEAIVDLAAAGLSVRRIVDVIPESDAAVQGAIASLVERGVLVAKR